MDSGEQKRERPDYDQALKRLVLRAHDAFLALVAPDLTFRAEVSPELPAVSRRADQVWLVTRQQAAIDPDSQPGAVQDDELLALFHVEFQTKVEPDIGERTAEYALRLYRREHLPVESVVIYLRPTANVPEPRFVLPGVGRDRMVDTYTVIRLWEVPQERVLEMPEYTLWPLAALMAGATVETTLAVAERIATVAAPLEERRELTGLLVTLAGLRMPRVELLAAVRRNPMIDELLRESSVAEEFIEEGRQEGRELGLREAVRLVLQGRLATLDHALVAAIERADEATLELVLLHAATDSPEQLRSRLGVG